MSGAWQALPAIEGESPVLALAADQGEWWAGGYGGVAHRRDGDDWGYPTTGLHVAPVTALCRAGGTLVAGGPGGLALSRDGGQAWLRAETEGAIPVVIAILASPRFEEDGLMLAAPLGGGIWRSQDGGRSWRPATFGLDDLEVTSLAWDHSGIVLAGAASGMFRSPNDGRAWKRVLDTGDAGIAAVTTCDDGTALAISEAGEVYRADEGGTAWTRFASLPDGIQPTALQAAPGALLLGTVDDGMWRSDDNGERWVRVSPEGVFALAGTAGRILAGTGEGVIASDDAGATWTAVEAPPLGDWHRLVIAGDDLIVAGARSQPVQHGPSGWEPLPVPSAPLTAIAPGPDGALLASSPDGLMRSEDGGGTWEPLVTGERGCVTHIALGNGGLGWAAGPDGALLRTSDGGRSWHDLDAPFRGLAVAALQAIPGELMAATRHATRGAIQLWRSTDDGQTWERGIEASTRWPVVCALADPPLITIGGSAVGQSSDGTWRRSTVTEGGGVRRAAGRGETVICLTNTGLFWSHDRGFGWHRDDADLPLAEVVDIALHGDTIHVLLTGGRVWTRPHPKSS